MHQAKPNRSFAVLKPFKLCFNNEIHRLSSIPDSYESLKENFRLVFKDILPLKWALQYDDSEGDRIMLTNEDDFQSMLECEAQSDSKSIRIYVVSTEGREEDPSGIQESLPAHTEDKRISFNDISKVESIMYCPNFKVQMEEDASICSKLEKLEQHKIDDSHSHDLLNKLEDKNDEEESKIYVVGEKILEEEEDNLRASQESDQKPLEKSMVELKKESKKEKLRELVREDMPYIVDLMQSYFLQQKSFDKKFEEAEPSKKESEQNKNIIDSKISCKGCGASPITGFIYKCSVCEDLFYCAKCEDSNEHAHPFLKVRNTKQLPKVILALFEEDVPKSCSMIKLSAVVTHDLGDSHIVKVFELEEKDQKFREKKVEKEEKLLKNVFTEVEEKDEGLIRKQREEEERFLKEKIEQEEIMMKEKMERAKRMKEEEERKRKMEEEEMRRKQEEEMKKKMEEMERIRAEEERRAMEEIEKARLLEEMAERKRQEEEFVKQLEEEKIRKEKEAEEERKRLEEEMMRRKMEEDLRRKQEEEMKRKMEEEEMKRKMEEAMKEEQRRLEEEKRLQEQMAEERRRQFPHNVTLVKELNTIPSEVRVKDRHIYKTVSLRNTGTKDWPLSSVFRNVSGLKGNNVRGIPLPVGAECSVVLIVENPGKSGEFTSTWSLACNDEKGALKNVGDAFDLKITVLPEVKKEMPEIKKEVPQIDPALVEKARSVKEIFPDQDYDKVLDFIVKNPKKTIEELIDHFMG